MKIQIEIMAQDASKKTAHLKKYLEKSKVKDLKSVSVDRKQIKSGQMAAGGGLVGSVSAIIASSTGPLTELMKVLGKYVEGFRTELKLKNAAGDEIVLSTTKLDKATIEKLVNDFMDKSAKTAKRRTVKKDADKDKKLPETENKEEIKANTEEKK